MSDSKHILDKLANHAIVDTGFPFKSERFTNDSNDIPLVKGENLQQGYIDWANAKYWSRHDVQDYNKYWLQPDDVVLAMDRPWVQSGLKWSCIKRNDPQAFLVQRVARLRAKKTVHQKFIRCLIGNEYFSGYIQPIVTGVNIPHISAKQIGDFLVFIPPFLDQVKIAAIVSAYDDLIENNDRRIALLEKMAEEIYREWFVRLRFPGHEQVTFHKGIPEGWEIKRFDKFCLLQRGFDLPDDKVKPGIYPVVASTSIKTYHSEFKVNPPVITTGRSGSLGTVLFVNSPAWALNTTLFVKNFFGNSPYLIYYTLKFLKLENFNAGAGVPSLNRNHLGGLHMSVPPKTLQDKFDKNISVIFNQKENIAYLTEILKQTRDRLLTRLISGKLSVEDLDIQFPPSMIEETTPTK
jgi:type I restriction enzyme, S subunit